LLYAGTAGNNTYFIALYQLHIGPNSKLSRAKWTCTICTAMYIVLCLLLETEHLRTFQAFA